MKKRGRGICTYHCNFPNKPPLLAVMSISGRYDDGWRGLGVLNFHQAKKAEVGANRVEMDGSLSARDRMSSVTGEFRRALLMSHFLLIGPINVPGCYQSHLLLLQGCLYAILLL